MGCEARLDLSIKRDEKPISHPSARRHGNRISKTSPKWSKKQPRGALSDRKAAAVKPPEASEGPSFSMTKCRGPHEDCQDTAVDIHQ
ncbi:unnamed protein product [Arctogadus glacialis]